MKQKLQELKEAQKELQNNYRYYMQKEDYNSLKNIAEQLYRNAYAIEILEELLK
jgi:hypothetical protein